MYMYIEIHIHSLFVGISHKNLSWFSWEYSECSVVKLIGLDVDDVNDECDLQIHEVDVDDVGDECSVVNLIELD